MFRHFCDGVRRFSSRRSDAGIVKENYFMVRSETVGDLWIPSVHVGVEVPKEQQRNSSSLSKATIGVTDSAGFNKLCRCRFVRVVVHRLSLTSFRLFCSSRRLTQDSNHILLLVKLRSCLRARDACRATSGYSRR